MRYAPHNPYKYSHTRLRALATVISRIILLACMRRRLIVQSGLMSCSVQMYGRKSRRIGGATEAHNHSMQQVDQVVSISRNRIYTDEREQTPASSKVYTMSM